MLWYVYSVRKYLKKGDIRFSKATNPKRKQNEAKTVPEIHYLLFGILRIHFQEIEFPDEREFFHASMQTLAIFQ